MAILHFKEGLQASLSNVAFDKGAVYITSDTKKLYVDLPDGSSVGADRICLGDFQLIEYSSGTAAAALNACTIKEPNVLYVTSNATDGHQLWRYNGTTFISLSSTNDVATLKADVAQLKTDVAGKAPIDHASSATTYGKGTSSNYGHVKLSDSTSATTAASSGGTAATPKAVSSALTAAKNYTDEAKTALLGDANSTGKNTIYEAYAKADAAATAAATAQREVDALELVVDGKAPKVHTSDSGSTYGAASTSVYGHTKLSSATNSDSEALAATPKAVKSAYDQATTGVNNAATAKNRADEAYTLAEGKAPKAHASTDTTYGKGDADEYGHLKLSDSTADTTSGVDAGTAATPKAVNAALNAAKTHANNIKTELLGSSSSTGGNTIYEAYAKANAAATAASTAQNEVDALEGVVSNLTTTVNGKAPTNHASSDTTYGAASTSKYGHAKLSSSITSDSEALAATPKAVKLAIADAKAYIDTKDSALRTAIDNLSNLMNFVGTTTTEITDGTTTTINKPSTVATDATYTAKAGDVVVDSKGKECVYDGSVWRLIGDTSALSTAVTNLQNTVGTKPSTPSMDSKLWDEVADLRTELGEKGDTANSAASASAFARLNAHDTTLATHTTNINNNKTSIDNIVLTLTWGSF